MSDCILFSAGDLSGDQNTAPAIALLKAALPSLRCVGLGGPAMTAAGFEPLFPFEKFNVMGYLEVLPRLPFLLGAKKRMVALLDEMKPRAVVCVDYSGFNMPLMRAARERGIPVLWFIAPMSWAWKNNKHIDNLKKYASHVAAIFPFEEAYFKEYFPHVSFVGNPTVEALGGSMINRTLPVDRPIRLAIVPGSRRQEISRMLPVMLASLDKLRVAHPSIQAYVSKSPNQSRSFYEPYLAGSSATLFEGPLTSMLDMCDCAAVTSGTATLATGLRGLPMVVMYKTSGLTYRIMKNSLTLKWISLPSIVAQKGLSPELIQDAATPDALYVILNTWLSDPAAYRSAAAPLADLREQLGAKTTSIELYALIRKIAGIQS